MKTIKSVTFLLIFCLAYTTGKSQSLQEGLRAIEIQKMETAKRIFQSLIKNDAQNSSLYYYLGTAYLGSSKPDSAKMYFDKGVGVNPNEPLNYVGIGTLALNKNDKAAANVNFDKAIELAPKKSSIAYIAISEALINSEYSDYNKAIQLLTKAKELDKANPKIYVLLGDAYVELLDGSNALKNYDKSLEINKNYPLGNLRLGETLVRIKNHDEALASFQTVLKQDSTYAPVYKDLGELYFQKREYEKAKDAYKKYVELTENNTAAKIRYAQFLFVSNDYANAVTEINNILKTDTTNNVIYRIFGYSLYETGNAEPDAVLAKGHFDAGVHAMQKFFSKVNTQKILTSDYEYYGKLLSKSGNDSLAIENMKTALKMDNTKTDLYALLAELYTKNKQYKEAAEAYASKIKYSKKVSIQDYHKMGLAYYYGNDFANGDSAFAKVVEMNPTFSGGYLWRAKCNEQIDAKQTEGLAKPHYEKFIELASADPVKYKMDLMSAYKYLGSYYFLQAKDNATSKTYWLKVKELDPNDKQMIDVLKAMK